MLTLVLSLLRTFLDFFRAKNVTRVKRNRMNSIRGTFEVHITVNLKDTYSVDSLNAVGSELGFKTTMILLSSGEFPSQLMTSSHMTGNYTDVKQMVQDQLLCPLSSQGYEVIRVKIESFASNQGVPESRLERASFPKSNYFEFHWKTITDTGALDRNYSALCKWGRKHNVHVSMNAFSKLATEDITKEYYFLTWREHVGGRKEALDGFDQLSNALVKDGWIIYKCEREYVVYDSNLALDRGWA